MQLLAGASKSKPRDDRRAAAAGDGAAAGRGDDVACAGAMLRGMPPVMWFIRRQMRRHRTCGLSVPQFRTLLILDNCPTASLSHVAEHLGVSQPSASRLVTGLVSRGFVTRKQCTEDRRQVALVLSARGKSVKVAAQRATQQSLAAEIAHLSDEQRETIVEAMELLHQVFSYQDAARGAKTHGAPRTLAEQESSISTSNQSA